MSKRRNTAEAAAEAPDTIESAAANPAEATQPGEPAAGSPPASDQDNVGQERQPGDEPAEQTKRKYEPVRGWTSRFTGPVKYRKFTDDTMKIIAFKFNLAENEKLPDDVLALMRDNKQDASGQPTGLRFQATRKHGKIWTLPNDVEGRAVADRIDFRLSQIAQKSQGVSGPEPF